MDGDLLDHIEKSNDSVDTTQLLDLLERETHQSGPLSSSVVRPPPAAVTNISSKNDDVIAVEKQPMSKGSSNDQSPQRRRRLRTDRSGYSSGDSHDSSFTSTLLGGNALLNLLEDDLNNNTTKKSSEAAPTSSTNGTSNYTVSPPTSDRSGPVSSGGGTESLKNSSHQQPLPPSQQQRSSQTTNNSLSTTPQKNSTMNYNSDSNSTRGSTANKYTRQAFDNPFGGGRRRLSQESFGGRRRLSQDSSVKSSGNNSQQSNTNNLVTNNNNKNTLAGSKGKKHGSGGDLALTVVADDAAETEAEMASVMSDGRRTSVSFSIDELNNHSDNRDADDEEDDGDDPQHNNNNSDSDDNQKHYASDTFSLTGSLASLAFSARSGSNRSRSSYTTRSSRSSRSSHGSATTASTHSSKSSQERRQRRELLPAITNDRKMNKKSNKKGGSSRRGSVNTDGSSRAGNSRSGSVASGSTTGTLNSLYRRNSKHKNKGKLYANLHAEHPTRYPQRSSMIQEEPNEDEFDYDGTTTISGLSYGTDLNSSSEDLFARTNKSGNNKSKEDSDDFLGGLIASTTTTTTIKNNVMSSLNQDDNASVGDTSFLSDFLSGHLNNNGGRAKQRKGGSVVSGMTSVTSNNHHAKPSILKKKPKKDYRDEGMAWVRRAIQRVRNWYENGDPLPRTRQECIQWCEDGGSLFPKTKKEWVQWGVLALILTPFLHLAVQYMISVNSPTNDYYGGEIQFISNNGVVGTAKANLAGKGGSGKSSLYSLGASKAWAGSSMVMLSRRSSPTENIILIPDADWIELQISRNHAATNADGRTSFFSRKRSSAKDAPKPPQRLPLPSVLDPIHDSTAAYVLFSLTASNGSNIPKKGSDISQLNAVANINLWNAVKHRLKPEPVDAWPSWSHNSLAQFREDSFTLMYPYSKRNEARAALVKLASEFGQSSFYEFITWSESSTGSDYGFSSGGDETKGALERAGSIRRIGEDGSAIIIPPLPDGRSDIMIRNTIIVDDGNSANTGGEHPSVVMRRVQDLPVEDELTMREFEGPDVDEITWSKKGLLKNEQEQEKLKKKKRKKKAVPRKKINTA